MKFLLSIFLFAALSAHSQTTPEVYNYISKGYITTLTQGLDFKKGYDYKELIKGEKFTGSLSSNTYQFRYCKFIKEGVPNNTLAFMVILLKNGSVDKVLCLPSAGSEQELWAEFYNDVTIKLFSDQKERLFQELISLFTYSVSALEKNTK